jgi:hypothetical protein
MRLLIHISLACALSSETLLYGATSTLSLGNGSGARSQNVSLPLAFVGSGNETSGLEWDLTYSTTDFSATTVSVGPDATAAAKSLLVCASPSAVRYNCVLIGLNRTLLGDGVVATTLTVFSTTTNSSSSVFLAVWGKYSCGTAVVLE